MDELLMLEIELNCLKCFNSKRSERYIYAELQMCNDRMYECVDVESSPLFTFSHVQFSLQIICCC